MSNFLLQSNHGEVGNFEVVMPLPHLLRGFIHCWRDNDSNRLFWHKGGLFGNRSSNSDVALIQSTFGNGNLEIVVRHGSRLYHYWRDDGNTWQWSGPNFIADGVRGVPALIQSSYGNFEVVAPLQNGKIGHWFRNNGLPNLPWNYTGSFGVGNVDAVSLIQSNFGNGNLEIVAKTGTFLYHCWRDDGNTGQWSGPTLIASGVSGTPAMILSTYGNFEVVTPLQSGGLLHIFRNNSASNLPWIINTAFGNGNINSVALIQSNFGNGNLEVVARIGSKLFHYWRNDGNTWQWNGPGEIRHHCRINLHFKILSVPNIDVDNMLDAMRDVFEPQGFRVDLRSIETLDLPQFNTVDIGTCIAGQTTNEQDLLFANRNFVQGQDIVIYFVQATTPPVNGCAAHPAGIPSAVVTSIASVWTMAHEVGHILGLNHVSNNDRLMTGLGTNNITNIPPDLINSEIQTMKNSSLTIC